MTVVVPLCLPHSPPQLQPQLGAEPRGPAVAGTGLPLLGGPQVPRCVREWPFLLLYQDAAVAVGLPLLAASGWTTSSASCT